MILSENDLSLILKHNNRYANRDDIAFKNAEGLNQLKNIDGHCIFFNMTSKLCDIYRNRPQGCRFYPLIYDPLRKKCVFDEECPHPKLFYTNPIQLKSICASLRRFLRDEFNIQL
jgi:Fe-S-cluster containining protein